MAAPDVASAPIPTIGGLTRQLTRQFREAGFDAAQVEARTIIGHVLGLDLTGLVLRADDHVDADAVTQVLAVATRRLAHEPLGRIVGSRQFRGLDLELSPATLEPRDDTEVLVERALRCLKQLDGEARRPVMADLGTGTGAIAIALLQDCPSAICVAVDISAAALATARGNAERHGVGDRCLFVRGSFADALATASFDVIVSNPPYIVSGEIAGLDVEVRDFDPRIALDGGSDGLDAYRNLIPQAKRALCENGYLLVEIGATQAAAVREIMQHHDISSISVYTDLAGLDRVVAGRAPGNGLADT